MSERTPGMVAESGRGPTPGGGLYAQVSGGDGPTVVLLHGLFGMGNNLGGIARALEDRYRVVRLDLPNHGRSPWCEAMDIPTLARCVAGWLDARVDGPVYLLGHSLGGKIGMQLALTAPQYLSALVVADIAPIDYAASHQRVFAAIEAVDRARPLSRRDAGELMRPHLREEGVIQFLLLSLERGEAGDYRWRFNAEALREAYPSLLKAPVGAAPATLPVLLIHGDGSDYVQDEGLAAARALFPRLQVTCLADAGHWLHAEQPERFNAAVRAFFDRQAGVAP